MSKPSRILPCLAGWMVVFCCVSLPWPVSGQNEERLNPQATEGRSVGEPISLSLRDADLAETLRTFAQLGNFNLVLDPAISGMVTVELKNVPWDQALEQILKVHGLGMDITGGRLLVASPPAIAQARADRKRRLESIRTVQLNLEHASATAVAACFARKEANILTAEGTAKARKASNTLILRDRAARLLEIGRLLVQLDIPQAAQEEAIQLQARCQKQWAELQTP